MTKPELSNNYSPETKKNNTTPSSSHENMIKDLVTNSVRDDKDHAKKMAQDLSTYLEKTYPKISVEQKHDSLKSIFGDEMSEYYEIGDLQQKLSKMKLGVAKDMINNIADQNKITANHQKKTIPEKTIPEKTIPEKTINPLSLSNDFNTKNEEVQLENAIQEKQNAIQLKEAKIARNIANKFSETKDLRTQELKNLTVQQSFNSYNTDLNTANPNVLSNISTSLSKGQATKIENADVSQMLFFRRIVKDNPQSTDIPQNIREQFADPKFTETFDALTSDFSVPKIDITNPYLSSPEGEEKSFSQKSISTLADSQIADTIATTPAVTKAASESLNMTARPENGDMREFDSKEMADKLGVPKSLNIPTNIANNEYETLQYTNMLDDLIHSHDGLIGNSGGHDIINMDMLTEEYGETAKLIAPAIMAYHKLKPHMGELNKIPKDTKENFLTTIKRGTDEMMLHMSDTMTHSLTAQTSEAYLQSIADSFIKSPNTQVVVPPTYNEQGQLVLTLKEDNNLNNSNTDTTYQLIFHPDGRVERTNVALVMDDSDHPVDFVRKGSSIITDTFPSVTDMIKKNADALTSTSIYDSIRDNDEPISVLISQQMRESIAENNNTVDVQLAMTQAELSHATLQGQVYESAITCFLTADAASENKPLQQHPLYHKLLSPNGQEDLGTGELGKFTEILTALRNTTEKMSSDEMLGFNESLRSFMDLQNQPIEYTSQLKDPVLSSFVHKGVAGKERTLPISPEGIQLADSGMDIMNMLIYNDGDDQRPVIDSTFFSAMNNYANTDQAKNISFDQSPEGRQRIEERNGNLGLLKLGFENLYGAYNGEREGADAGLKRFREDEFNEELLANGDIIINEDNTPQNGNLERPPEPLILNMSKILKGEAETEQQNTQNAIALAQKKFVNGQAQTTQNLQTQQYAQTTEPQLQGQTSYTA